MKETKESGKWNPEGMFELDVFEVGDVVSDGVYLSDLYGTVLRVNNSYSKITGIEAHEVLGRCMQQVLNEKYATGEYVVLKLEHVHESELENGMEQDESYVTDKPASICGMVLEQRRMISIMATLSVMGTNKKILFMGKPYFDEQGQVSHVLTVIRDLTDFNRLQRKLSLAERENRKYLDELLYLRSNQLESDLIGRHPSVELMRQLINHTAKTDATVLITGETGVGKEVVAREIYKRSTRSDKPYVKVNCAAIPESLIESELFGYEKGAFTGADRKEKLGYFEIANGGTILLDEIGEMPVKLQSKLLRVLQEKEITRLGGTKTIRLDVRVIASTNQNIEEQIKQRTFREDLYYRLNVIPVKIPPLRERTTDIVLLACEFLKRFNKKYKRSKEFETEAFDLLEQHNWPGNVRELENVVERLVVVGDEPWISAREVAGILGKEMAPYPDGESGEMTLKEAVDQLEKSILTKALKKYGSTHKAAKALGVTQPTVLRKAKALGIEKW